MDIKIYENYAIVHNAIFLIKQNTLVIADLHLAFDESLRNQGVMMPLTHTKQELSNLNLILESLKEYDIKNIVFNGDIKHEFGAVLRTEDRSFKQLLELSKKYNLYFVKGNHDKIVDAYLSRINPYENVFTTDMLVIDDYAILHGDSDLDDFFEKQKDMMVIKNNTLIKENLKKSDFNDLIFIIGHEHPVIVLQDNHRSEKYKALLISDKVIVLPSFNPAILGVEINAEYHDNQYLSPLLNDILPDDFELFLFSDDIESKVFYFGKLSEL